LSRKLDSMRIRETYIAGNVSAYVFFFIYIIDSIDSIVFLSGRSSGRTGCEPTQTPEWSREVSAAWSRVGFSTSRSYILIIIIVGRSLLMRMPERTWTPWNDSGRDERDSAEGWEGERVERKDDDLHVLCKNAQTSVLGDNSRLVASSGHPLDSRHPTGICRPSFRRRSFPRPFHTEAG